MIRPNKQQLHEDVGPIKKSKQKPKQIMVYETDEKGEMKRYLRDKVVKKRATKLKKAIDAEKLRLNKHKSEYEDDGFITVSDTDSDNEIITIEPPIKCAEDLYYRPVLSDLVTLADEIRLQLSGA